MADSSHRLAVHQAMGRAQDAEQARQDSHSPTVEHGGDPGVTLDGASPGDLDVLGMSAGAEIPDDGEPGQGLNIPWDYRA